MSTLAYAAPSTVEEAVRILTDAYRAHDGWIVFAACDSALRGVRADPRVQVLLRQLARRRR